MNNREEQEDETYNQEEAKGLKSFAFQWQRVHDPKGDSGEKQLESLSSQVTNKAKKKL